MPYSDLAAFSRQAEEARRKFPLLLRLGETKLLLEELGVRVNRNRIRRWAGSGHLECRRLPGGTQARYLRESAIAIVERILTSKPA